MRHRRLWIILGSVVGLYLLADVLYIVKSLNGVDVMHDGVHHGPWFVGSDWVMEKVRAGHKG